MSLLTTNIVKQINISRLSRDSLAMGSEGLITWKSNTEKPQHIHFRTGRNQIIFKFRYSDLFTQSVIIQQIVPLEKTACHFGGHRLWFNCNCCNNRVAILYGASKIFLCRKCSNLRYKSQYESYLSRLIAKKDKLAKQTFQNHDYGYSWGRKKRLHKTTYLRKKKRYDELSSLIDSVTLKKYGIAYSNL